MDPTFNKNNQQTPYQMSLQVRRPFPPSWWGLCDETLFAMCKVDGATFVQKSGFICGHKTMAGAFAMAAASLKSHEISTNPSTVEIRKRRISILRDAIKKYQSQTKGAESNAARCVAQYNQVIGNEFLGIGNIEEAISHFGKAYSFYLSNYEKNYTTFEKQDFDHLDTCAVFYGESLEHSCVHIFKAIRIIKDKILFNNAVCKFYDEKRNVFQTFPVSTLLLLKLLYVSPVYRVDGSDASCSPNSTGQVDDDGQILGPPSIDLILELLQQIGKFPSDLKAEIRRRFKSHWAFYLFIKALVEDEVNTSNGKNSVSVFYCHEEIIGEVESQSLENNSMLKPINRWQHFHASKQIPYPPLFVIGDSHTLTYAWRSVRLQGALRTCIPILITGIKAWHFRENTDFYTNTALQNALLEINKASNARELVVSAGEIDVREGIGRALDNGHYRTLQQAVEATVLGYVTELANISTKYSVILLLLPVPPHAKRPSKGGRWRNRERRRKACTLFNNALRVQCDKAGPSLQYLDFIDALYIEGETTSHQKDQEIGFIENPETRVLNPKFDSDKTHLNRHTLSLLQKTMDKV